MSQKTVLVASRHSHLEDVRKRVLEKAGYRVISIRSPEQVQETCNEHKVDLILIGYSVTAAEKRRIAAESIRLCKCPVLELWDREPPQLRNEHRVFDHFSLTAEDSWALFTQSCGIRLPGKQHKSSGLSRFIYVLYLRERQFWTEESPQDLLS